MKKLELCFADAAQFGVACAWFGAEGGSYFFANEVHNECNSIIFYESNNMDSLEAGIERELAEIGLSDYGFVYMED